MFRGRRATVCGVRVGIWGVAAALLFGIVIPSPAEEVSREAIEITIPKRETPVNFTAEILPVLRQNCIACHNRRDDEAGVVLDSVEAILRGGDAGPLVVPGNGADSPLLAVAARKRRPHMPPPANKVGAQALTPEQLGLLQLWIDQGAKPGRTGEAGRVVRRPLPLQVSPILALALSPEDELVACSRGARLHVYRLQGPSFEAELTDPALPASAGADRDLVRSLAFDRQGLRLASGGYRTVRIWQRPRSTRLFGLATGHEIRSLAVDRGAGLVAVGTASGAVLVRAVSVEGAIRVWNGPAAAVESLQFSRIGLISAGADQSLRLWKVEDGSLRANWKFACQPRSLCLTPDSRELVVGGEDGVIRRYPLESLEAGLDQSAMPTPSQELPGHTQAVRCLAASSAWNDRLVSGSEDGRVRLWDLVSGQTLREFAQESAVVSVAIRPDGSRIASGGLRGWRLWNSADGSLVTEVREEWRSVREIQRADGALQFAKNNIEYRKQEHREAEEALKREQAVVEGALKTRDAADKSLAEKVVAATKARDVLAAAERQARAMSDQLQEATARREAALESLTAAQMVLKDAQSKLEQARAALEKDKDNQDLARAVQKGEEGQTAARKSLESAQSALDSATSERTLAQTASQRANQERDTARNAAQTPERELTEAQIAAKGAVNFIATAQAILEKAQGAVPAALQAVAAAEALAAERESAKQQLLAAQNARTTGPRPVRSVAFSDDGRLLAVAGEGWGGGLYQGERGTPLEALAAPTGLKADSPDPTFVVGGAEGLLVTCTANGLLSGWQTASDWQLSRTIGDGSDSGPIADRVLSVDFSPDGALLATAGGLPAEHGELLLWNPADGTLVRRIPTPHRDTIQAVRFSPDGQYLATASADRLVKVFRVADGEPVRTLAGHGQHVLGVAWRADGQTLVSCGGDQVVKVWNLQSGAAVKTMRGTAYRIGEYRRAVTSVAFVGDRDQFVASSGDKTVRLHRLTSDQDIFAFTGGQAYLHVAIATSDGKLVLGGGHDGVLHAWSGENTYRQFSFGPREPGLLIKPQ